MFAPLVDFFTGRASAWKAKYNAAFVTLVNPNTGEPYVAGGGGGGSSLADVVLQDANGVLVLQRDDGVSLTYVRLSTGLAFTPALPLVTPTTPVTGPLTDAQLRATAVPVSAAALPLPTGASTETTLAALNTKVPAQNVPNLLPVDTLGTPSVPRVQATSAAAASIVLTTTCRRVSMYATQGTWYSISGTATATSHYIATGERIDIDVPANTTISVLRETTDGSIRITELV